MKINEKKDLQTKTKLELVKLLQEAQTELVNAKLDHQQNKLQNTSMITNIRKRIAVLKTVLNGKPAEVKEVKKSSSAKATEDKGGKK